MAAPEMERHPSDGWPVLSFQTPQALEAWLDRYHAEEPGLWIRFPKKGRGIASVTVPEAVEVALCFGWIDSKMHSHGDHYVLRFQPRRRRSPWSARNKGTSERLIADGRMRPAGLAQVEAAKADGRWDVS